MCCINVRVYISLIVRVCSCAQCYMSPPGRWGGGPQFLAPVFWKSQDKKFGNPWSRLQRLKHSRLLEMSELGGYIHRTQLWILSQVLCVGWLIDWEGLWESRTDPNCNYVGQQSFMRAWKRNQNLSGEVHGASHEQLSYSRTDRWEDSILKWGKWQNYICIDK